jgi:tetrahydromethanopterin S-methyltransferase subunit A
VCGIVRAHDLNRLLDLIWLVDVIDSDDSERCIVTRIAECNTSSRGQTEAFYVCAGDVEGDGDREESTVRQAEVLDDGLVVTLVHETLQWREAAIHD